MGPRIGPVPFSLSAASLSGFPDSPPAPISTPRTRAPGLSHAPPLGTPAPSPPTSATPATSTSKCYSRCPRRTRGARPRTAECSQPGNTAPAGNPIRTSAVGTCMRRMGSCLVLLLQQRCSKKK